MEGLKVPLTPQNFIPLIKSTSFLDFFNQEIILIDKIPAYLQAFEHVISTFTAIQSGIWVRLLVTIRNRPTYMNRKQKTMQLFSMVNIASDIAWFQTVKV